MLKSKQGFSTITVVLIIAILAPLLILVAVDIPYSMQINRKVKSISDNAAASAAVFIDSKLLAKGIVKIDEEKAETYILENMAEWFNLEDTIYETDIPVYYQNEGVQRIKLIKIREGKDSILGQDPLIIRIGDGMEEITDEKVLKASKIEYFIHPTEGQGTYRFITGQKVKVFNPTVGIKITTKTETLIFNIPINISKIGMTEATYG